MSSGVLTRSRTADSAPGMDPRLQARRVEVALDARRRRRRRSAALVVVTVVALAAVAVARSPLFDVDRTVVDGVARLSVDEVLEAAGVVPGDPMVDVDAGAVARRVESLPWVADARVERSWPGTLRVNVTERRAVAVAGEGPSAVAVDFEGRILGAAGPDDGDLPLAGPAPVAGPGGFLDDERLVVAGVLAELTPALLGEVAAADVADDGTVVVHLDDGITVRLGDGTRLRARAAAVLAVLAQADRATIATVDVTVAGSPALTRHDREEP